MQEKGGFHIQLLAKAKNKKSKPKGAQLYEKVISILLAIALTFSAFMTMPLGASATSFEDGTAKAIPLNLGEQKYITIYGDGTRWFSFTPSAKIDGDPNSFVIEGDYVLTIRSITDNVNSFSDMSFDQLTLYDNNGVVIESTEASISGDSLKLYAFSIKHTHTFENIEHALESDKTYYYSFEHKNSEPANLSMEIGAQRLSIRSYIPTGGDEPLYNPNDIAVINAIIDNNGLNWEKASADGSSIPTDWSAPVSSVPVTGWVNDIDWSDDSTNKRVTHIILVGENLYGNLDLTGLDELQVLQCSDNQLVSIDISTNAKLESLYCYDNQLTSLDLSHNIALETLDCNNNQLSILDVSSNIALCYMLCKNNKLNSLNVLSNTNLLNLNCSENYMKNKSSVLGWENIDQFTFFPQKEDNVNKILMLGDLNGDGAITASDARTALRISAMLETPSDIQLQAADVDGDGKITAKDARKILRVSAQLEVFD